MLAQWAAFHFMANQCRPRSKSTASVCVEYKHINIHSTATDTYFNMFNILSTVHFVTALSWTGSWFRNDHRQVQTKITRCSKKAFCSSSGDCGWNLDDATPGDSRRQNWQSSLHGTDGILSSLTITLTLVNAGRSGLWQNVDSTFLQMCYAAAV